MEQESGHIRRKALGRGGELGSLYDARTDTLIIGNIFNCKLPEDGLCEIDCHKSDFKYDESNSWSTALDKLNIEAELKLRVLFRQVDIEGNGKYLKTVNKSGRVDRVALYRVCIKQHDNWYGSASKVSVTAFLRLHSKIDEQRMLLQKYYGMLT